MQESDELDARLRDDLPYVDDEGFTARVMQQLPVRRLRSRARPVLLTLVGVVGVLIAYGLAGGAGFLMDLLGWFAVMPLSVLYAVAIFFGLVVMGFGVLAAMSRARRLRS